MYTNNKVHAWYTFSFMSQCFFPFCTLFFLGCENEVLLQSHKIQCAQNTIEGELCCQCFNLPCT